MTAAPGPVAPVPAAAMRNATGEPEHLVQFYEDDEVLLDAAADYLAEAIACGGAGFAIATPAHLEGLERHWRLRGLDAAAARARGQLVTLDATEVLKELLVDGRLDAQRLEESVASLVTQAAASFPRVRVFGETVSLLCREGRAAAAVRLEDLWRGIAQRHGLETFCAYRMQDLGTGADRGLVRDICVRHTRVVPAESYDHRSTADDRLHAIVELQRRASALESEMRARRALEQELARRDEELSDFLETAVEGLHKVGPDGRILWANRAKLELLGHTLEELVGRRYLDLHADPVAAAGLVQRLLAGESLREEPATLIARDGSLRFVRVSSSPLWRDGELVYTRCFTRDVTRERRDALELSERHAVLRLAVRGARLGIWVRDLTDDSMRWSPELEEIFGLTPGTFEGKLAKFRARVHPEDWREVEKAVADAIADRRECIVEFRFRHASGEWRWMEARGQAVYDDAGRPLRLYGIGMDVTARKEAERTRALLAAIVECSDDAIISKTLDGRITSWNAAATRLYGYTAEEAIGRPITIIVPPELEREEREILARIAGGERIEHYETVRVARDGRRLDVSLTVSPIRDDRGRVIGASKVARDITERKRIEEQLREANRRTDEFLATLAHELRNPLAPIRNAAEIIRIADSDRARVAAARSLIERQLQHLTRLIDDLLDASRITQGRLELRRQRIELGAILQLALETSRPVIESRLHRLQIEQSSGPLIVHGDVTRLAQVVSNLLNNAAKYSHPGGTITVTLAKRRDRAVISVADTGIGIRREMLSRVFDMFVRTHSAAEVSEDGLGIGLTLVRQLVELHGGSVSAYSEGPGKGSTFEVSLPLATRAEDEDPRPGELGLPRTGTDRPCRILVADDNVDSALSLSMLLSLDGHDVRTAHDGLEAVEIAVSFEPAIVLLDIGMPRLDGFGAARRLRADPRTSRATLIALTGWGQDEDQRRTREAGFDHHLVKPVDPEALRLLIVECPRPE